MIPEGTVDPAVGGLLVAVLALFVFLVLNGLQLREQRKQFEGQIARAFTRGKIHGAELERRRARQSRRDQTRIARKAAQEVRDAS